MTPHDGEAARIAAFLDRAEAEHRRMSESLRPWPLTLLALRLAECGLAAFSGAMLLFGLLQATP